MFVELTHRILNRTKGRLEKELGQSEDLLARLVARNKSGDHTEYIAEVEAAHLELEKCLRSVRTHLGEWSLLSGSDEVPEDALEAAGELIAAMQAHQQGIKAIGLDMKGKLS